MILVRGEGYQDWSSCWIHAQPCPCSDNHATAHKTKHMLHAPQGQCGNVSSCGCLGGCLGCFLLRVWGCLLECPPVNDNTEQSCNAEISTCEFATSTKAQALHFMAEESHTHLQPKPTLVQPPLLQFCRISCSRGDNELVLQRGQPRWKGLKLHTGGRLAVGMFLSFFLDWWKWRLMC